MLRYFCICGFFAATLALFAVVDRVDAFSSGLLGYSGNPATNGGNYCTLCHSGGIVPTVTLSGPATVAPGSTNSYMLVISGGQEIAGGLDVSATAGTLINTDPGTQLLSGEITHATPKAADGNREVVFTFDWQAPALPGSATIYAAGNSVNLNGTTSGDNASATSLQVVIQAASGTPGETSGEGLAPLLVHAYDNLTGEIEIGFETGCDTDDNNLYFGDLAQVSTLDWSGEVCSIGTAGNAVFDPGAGSYFFVVVGNMAGKEGSYGLSGAGVERTDFALATCGDVQDLSSACMP